MTTPTSIMYKGHKYVLAAPYGKNVCKKCKVDHTGLTCAAWGSLPAKQKKLYLDMSKATLKKANLSKPANTK